MARKFKPSVGSPHRTTTSVSHLLPQAQGLLKKHPDADLIQKIRLVLAAFKQYGEDIAEKIVESLGLRRLVVPDDLAKKYGLAPGART